MGKLLLAVFLIGPMLHPSPSEARAGDGPLLLDVQRDGEISVGEERLYDPAQPDGHVDLRSWLAREAARARAESEGREAPKLELLVRGDPEAPAEAVQGILECCRRRDVRIGSVHLELAGTRIEPALERDEELGDADATTARLRLEVEIEEAAADPGESRTLAYTLGSLDAPSSGELAKALGELARSGECRRIVLEPRRGVSCGELRAALGAVLEAGLEEVAIAPIWWEVHARAIERWDSIADDDWSEAYEFLTPERRDTESLEQFLVGKEHHEYRDVSDVRVLSFRGDRAIVSLRVSWTPKHPELRELSDQDLTQELRMAETWAWVEGTWYCAQTQRLSDVLAEHPELEDEVEDD